MQHRGECRRLVLSISNTDRALLEFVREKVGVGQITSKRTYSPLHAPSYAFRIASRQALDLLAQIAAHLRTYRRDRAEMALREYLSVTPRNGKYASHTLCLKADFERRFLALGPGPRAARRRCA